jgi:hypothetical protein
MAEAVVDNVHKSETKFQCLSGNMSASCVNCVLLNKQLLNVLQELKSMRSIMALLQDGIRILTSQIHS